MQKSIEFHNCHHIAKGFRGLYKGFVPGIWGVSHCAVKFMIYEELKSNCHKYKNQSIDTKLGFFENLTCGATAQFFAILITYPHQGYMY